MSHTGEMEECITVRVPRGTSLALGEPQSALTRVPVSLLGACSWTGCARAVSSSLRLPNLAREGSVSDNVQLLSHGKVKPCNALATQISDKIS